MPESGTQEQNRSQSEHHESPKWFEELLQQRRLSELKIKDRRMRSHSAHPSSDTQLEVFEYPDRKWSLDEGVSIQDEKANKREEKSVNFLDLLLQKPLDLWSEPKTTTSRSAEPLLQQSDLIWTSGTDLSAPQQMKTSSANASFNTTEITVNKVEKKNFIPNNKQPAEQLLLNQVATSDQPSDEFIIPIEPKGSQLRICILSNWGDEQYVGLNGIEVFEADEGRPAAISQVSLRNIATYTMSKLGLWSIKKIFLVFEDLLQTTRPGV